MKRSIVESAMEARVERRALDGKRTDRRCLGTLMVGKLGRRPGAALLEPAPFGEHPKLQGQIRRSSCSVPAYVPGYDLDAGNWPRRTVTAASMGIDEGICAAELLGR